MKLIPSSPTLVKGSGQDNGLLGRILSRNVAVFHLSVALLPSLFSSLAVFLSATLLLYIASPPLVKYNKL
jgi:hypothetical protein